MERKAVESLGFGSKAIHAGNFKDLNAGALATPIYATSTFIFDSAEQGGRRFALEEDGYIYSRLGNPTTKVVEDKIAILEGAEACAAAASGIGAISSALWSALKAGDHVVASDTLYGCTFSLLNHGLTRFGVEVDFVDITDPENVRKAMKPNTRVVYLETPANPTLKISDVRKISEIAHENKDCMVFVDNTFCTPFIQRPLTLGADVVLHSATKYLNGHGDVVAGFVAGSAEFITQVKLFGIKDMTGAVLSAFDAFLIGRGLKTLEVRMKQHCANAKKVAEFLEEHKAVDKVFYPGLDSFEQKELAASQMQLPGAMIAFELKGGVEEGKKLLNSLNMIKLAVSLGDAETLIEHPASMTHSPYTKEEREASGISDGLVRISVGLESVNDIINDLNESLNKLV
ncbi:methionine gamma-lyase [Peptostreptococcus russellii]|uniref:L-methionine gamma-lyase n=1 Tax=Peptostreptococcus russellii TaxID=215200 RepID=A0A1H8KKI1_9FIRM|nr:methionine gamma-lyase [Peptostreptococcus russellii]SEN93469.1 methionine-gamma-lyase [Peptostreptococcus russellii]